MDKLPRYHAVRTDRAGINLPHNRRLMTENAVVDAELKRQASAQLAARAMEEPGPTPPPGGWKSTMDFLKAKQAWLAAQNE